MTTYIIIVVDNINKKNLSLSFSPYNWNSSNTHANVFDVGGSGNPGYLGNDWVNNTHVVRPSNFSLMIVLFITVVIVEYALEKQILFTVFWLNIKKHYFYKISTVWKVL